MKIRHMHYFLMPNSPKKFFKKFFQNFQNFRNDISGHGHRYTRYSPPSFSFMFYDFWLKNRLKTIKMKSKSIENMLENTQTALTRTQATFVSKTAFFA